MNATVDNNTKNDGDGRSHVGTSGVLSAPSSIATENTGLSPRAKQTYFKEYRVQIPHTEKVCTVKHNVVLGITQIVNTVVYLFGLVSVSIF
jgi:hypothetical protein